MPEPIESIEVPVSPENGNVPADVPAAPSPAPKEPVAPAEPVAPVATTEPELFELPDGRKVDAATVATEYKNLLSDYTRKSQDLARITQGQPKPADINKPASTNPLDNPEYVPGSYGELAKVIRESTIQELRAEEQKKADERKAIEDTVTEQLNAVKAIDKTVDENKLFLHATKYQFKDLRVAHQNMIDMAKLAKDVKQATAKDVLKRNDPVSVTPGANGGTRPDPSQFATARDYLRSLQN